MFSTLLASRPARASSTSGTAVSLLLHGAILMAAALAGLRQQPALEAPRETRAVKLVPFSRPVAARPPAAARPKPSVAPAVESPTLPPLPVPTAVPTSIPEPSAEPWLPAAELPLGTPSPSSSTGGGEVEGNPEVGGTALGATEVQQAAALRPNSPLPRYPDFLRAQRLEGRAVARFVVGADGRVEPGTLIFVESTHPAFEEAVRAALPRLRFSPGRVQRRAVRQWVELPFGFRLTSR